MALYLGRQKIAPIVNTIDVALADATESDVKKGKTFFSGNAEIKTGTLEVPDLSATTATAEDVLQGKKFYNAEGELVEGSYKDMLQRKVDWSKSCENLFRSCPDEDMSWVKNLDTTGVTNMKDMFTGCGNAIIIDISNFDTSAVTTMYSMFQGCSAVKELDLSNFDTSSLTSVYCMFFQAMNLTHLNIENFNTSNVTTFDRLFYNCKVLETVVGTLDLLNATSSASTRSMLAGCYKLKDISLKNIRVSLELNSSNNLSTETLTNAILQLWDLTGGTPQTLTLYSTNKNKIANIYVKLIPVTDEMRAEDEYIDNKKPCVVCESTDEGAMTLTEYAISKNWAIA